MKNLVIIIFCLFGLTNSNGQIKSDSIIDPYFYEEFNIKILENLDRKKFRIVNQSGEITFKDLKYAAVASSLDGIYIQILDRNGEMYFLNTKLEKTEITGVYFGFGLCGTVPHYEMRILEKKNSFYVMIDETFYDYGNNEPEVIHSTISKTEADSVYFLNGKTEFNFDGNYGINSPYSVSAETVIIEKNGKQKVHNGNGIWYDEIKGFYTKKDGLIGIYRLIEPKYKRISDFEYRLAKFELPNGKTGWIDVKGNEYYD